MITAAAHGRRPSAHEQDHGHADHQPVGERVGDLAERRLDVPAAGEPAVELVGGGGSPKTIPPPSWPVAGVDVAATTKSGIAAKRSRVSAFGICRSGAETGAWPSPLG